jgi:hypothetical protein
MTLLPVPFASIHEVITGADYLSVFVTQNLRISECETFLFSSTLILDG